MTCFFFNPALPLSSGSQTMVGVRITGALGKDAQALACWGSLAPVFCQLSWSQSPCCGGVQCGNIDAGHPFLLKSGVSGLKKTMPQDRQEFSFCLAKA